MERRQQQAEGVYRSSTKKDCHTRALVLEAVGIGCKVEQTAGEYTLAAWHEELGEQKLKITVGAASSPALEFSFKAKAR